MKTQEAETSTTLAALNAARNALHTARVESASFASALEIAQNKYLADSTAKHQAAVISAEENARFAEMRSTAASQNFEAAKAAHAAFEKAARLAEIAARQTDVNLATFDRAIAATVSKHAELLSKLDDVLSEEKRLISGFLSEQTSIARDAAALSVPVPPALDFDRIVQSRLMAARGSQASEVLAEVWKATAPAGVDSPAALAAILGGLDLRRVQGLIAKTRDATSRAAATAKIVVQGGFESPRAAKSSTAVGRFNAAYAEAKDARKALSEIGIGIGIKIGGAADAVAVDQLSERLAIVGADKAHSAFLALRMCAGLTMSGYPTAQELESHRNEAAQKIIAQLEAMGLGEYVEAVRPTRAHTPATIGAQGAAFAEVSL